ncbi:MAG: ABC transporter ATP-binding protein [Desulfobacterales bacterium]
MLSIEGLNAYYGGIRALSDISIRVPRGKVVSIIGANGAGKTTLLKSISGLMRHKTGNITFNGAHISQLQADRIVKRGLSHVPEGRQLFAHLSVEDNLRLGAYHCYTRKNRRLIAERMNHAYRLFPILEKRSGQIAGTLSGGEQQMLAIARALMAHPRMMLLDEPSMGIAPLIVRELFNVITGLNKDGVTILLVEQNAKAALKAADYAYVLEGGSVVMEGLPKEMLDNPRIKEIYLGG